MAAFLIACLIVAFPFLLIFLEKDRFQSALKVSAALIDFSILIALITQAFGVFDRPVVLSIFLLADAGIALVIIYRKSAFIQNTSKT